jgi:hypothetical protein
LVEGKFEFAIVGGVAAVMHGASRMTMDLDVVAPFDPDNLLRLVAALKPHRPVHATRPELSLLDEPLERLVRFRLFLIDTTLGRLDVLREVAPVGDYARVETMEAELLGQRVRVISRDQLITIKRALGRPKDLEVAVELEALRERDLADP